MTLFLSILLTIGWNPNTESDLAGYNVYQGTASRVYTTRVNVGNVMSNSFAGLQPGVTYYFAVAAYNEAGAESDYSAEVSFMVPIVQEPIMLSVARVAAIRLDWNSASGGVYEVESTMDAGWQWFGWQPEATNLVASGTGMVWRAFCDEPLRVYRVARIR